MFFSEHYDCVIFYTFTSKLLRLFLLRCHPSRIKIQRVCLPFTPHTRHRRHHFRCFRCCCLRSFIHSFVSFVKCRLFWFNRPNKGKTLFSIWCVMCCHARNCIQTASQLARQPANQLADMENLPRETCWYHWALFCVHANSLCASASRKEYYYVWIIAVMCGLNWLCKTIERQRFMTWFKWKKGTFAKIFSMISFTIFCSLSLGAIGEPVYDVVCVLRNGHNLAENVNNKPQWNHNERIKIYYKHTIKKECDDQIVRLILFFMLLLLPPL